MNRKRLKRNSLSSQRTGKGAPEGQRAGEIPSSFFFSVSWPCSKASRIMDLHSCGGGSGVGDHRKSKLRENPFFLHRGTRKGEPGGPKTMWGILTIFLSFLLLLHPEADPVARIVWQCTKAKTLSFEAEHLEKVPSGEAEARKRDLLNLWINSWVHLEIACVYNWTKGTQQKLWELSYSVAHHPCPSLAAGWCTCGVIRLILQRP